MVRVHASNRYHGSLHNFDRRSTGQLKFRTLRGFFRNQHSPETLHLLQLSFGVPIGSCPARKRLVPLSRLGDFFVELL
jgi:hypothetical protein